MSIQERIETLKKENDRKKQEKNRIEGRLDSLKQQLKDEYDCNTIEELQAMIDKLEPELQAQEQDILTRLAKMESYEN